MLPDQVLGCWLEKSKENWRESRLKPCTFPTVWKGRAPRSAPAGTWSRQRKWGGILSFASSYLFFFPFKPFIFNVWLAFSFSFLLYNIVLVLPYINMNPPRVYTCTPIAVILWRVFIPQSLDVLQSLASLSQREADSLNLKCLRMQVTPRGI